MGMLEEEEEGEEGEVGTGDVKSRLKGVEVEEELQLEAEICSLLETQNRLNQDRVCWAHRQGLDKGGRRGMKGESKQDSAINQYPEHPVKQGKKDLHNHLETALHIYWRN